jgi:formylglycine-generating enzyme required for sulfatase activity
MTSDPAIHPHALSDRAAMGLPDRFVDRVDQRHLGAACRRMAAVGRPEMLRRVEDPAVDFITRLACGMLLALLGDPRIDVDNPAMVDVPAASVRLGMPVGQVDAVVDTWRHVGVARTWILKETPQYEATIGAFRIGRYPVTNLEYREFLTENPRAGLPTSWRFGAYPAPLANHPVWTVRAGDADGYAEWLSQRTGRRFRLATEAEWEYAASGGDGRTYPWGEESGAGLANTVESGPLTTTPVGIYPRARSPFGADDMAGNVEEYVTDDYRPYPGGPVVHDDLCDGHRTYRVARGGGFTRYADLARCSRRHGRYDREMYAVGFRLAETPTTSS